MKRRNQYAALSLCASLLSVSGCSMMMGEEEVAEQAPQRPAMNCD